MPNYRLSCTNRSTQNILLFLLTNGAIVITMNLANAKFAKNIVRNTLIVVLVATLTFTLDVLFYCIKVRSTTTHWLPFASRSCSLATFVAKKARVCPICVSYVVSGHIKDVLIFYTKSKLYVTITSSTSSIPLKSINLTPHFVNYVFEKWIHTMGFTVAPHAIFLPTLIVLRTRQTWTT